MTSYDDDGNYHHHWHRVCVCVNFRHSHSAPLYCNMVQWRQTPKPKLHTMHIYQYTMLVFQHKTHIQSTTTLAPKFYKPFFGNTP